MDLKKINIMVIGSKPQNQLPDIDFDKIYAANGAAEVAYIYKKKKLTTNIISIVSNNSLNFPQTKSKIENLCPDEIVTTNGKVNLNDYFHSNWIKKVKYRQIDNKGRDLQRKYFSNLNMRLADLSLIFSNNNLFFGILRFFYGILIKRRQPMGLSTGCLSILIALTENRNSRVFVAGIGLTGGGHFYRVPGSFPNYRGWTDAFLIKRLPKSLKSRIVTIDENFSKIAKVELLKIN